MFPLPSYFHSELNGSTVHVEFIVLLISSAVEQNYTDTVDVSNPQREALVISLLAMI